MFKNYDPELHCFVELYNSNLKFLIDRKNEQRVREYKWGQHIST